MTKKYLEQIPVKLKRSHLKYLNIFFTKYMIRKIHSLLPYQEKKCNYNTNLYFTYNYTQNFSKTIWRSLKIYKK